MKKYILETYGWQMEGMGHSLTNEQVAQIEQIMSEEGYDELWQARDDIEEKLGIYIWEPDMFHISKPFDNGSMRFYVKDEDDNVVVEFDIDKTSDFMKPFQMRMTLRLKTIWHSQLKMRVLKMFY